MIGRQTTRGSIGIGAPDSVAMNVQDFLSASQSLNGFHLVVARFPSGESILRHPVTAIGNRLAAGASGQAQRAS